MCTQDSALEACKQHEMIPPLTTVTAPPPLSPINRLCFCQAAGRWPTMTELISRLALTKEARWIPDPTVLVNLIRPRIGYVSDLRLNLYENGIRTNRICVRLRKENLSHGWRERSRGDTPAGRPQHRFLCIKVRNRHALK